MANHLCLVLCIPQEREYWNWRTIIGVYSYSEIILAGDIVIKSLNNESSERKIGFTIFTKKINNIF